MALKGVDKKEEMEMVDIEKGIEVEPQRLSAMESLEKLLEGMRLTEEVDEEALREKRSRQIDERAGQDLGKYDPVLPLQKIFSYVAPGEEVDVSHRLSAMESLENRLRGTSLSGGVQDGERRRREELLRQNGEIYDALQKKYEKTRLASEEFAEKQSKGSTSSPSLSSSKEEEEFKRSIQRTEVKNKKDEQAWLEEEKAYTRSPHEQAAKLVPAWQEIIAPLLTDKSEISEELKRKEAAKSAAREFAIKEAETAKLKKKPNPLPKDLKELNRELKTEMRGLTPAKRETIKADPLKQPKKEPILIDAPVMTILPKTHTESSWSDYLGKTPHDVYHENREKIAKELTPFIAKQAEKAVNVRQRWHELMHPLEDAARKKALADQRLAQDKLPPSAIVAKACEGALVEGEPIAKEKSGRPVVTAFLSQKPYVLEPFHKMLRSHQLESERLKKEEEDKKSQEVSGIVDQKKKLTHK